MLEVRHKIEPLEVGSINLLDHQGHGEKAIAVLTLLGCSVELGGNYWHIFHPDHAGSISGGWRTPGRAALSVCIINKIPFGVTDDENNS